VQSTINICRKEPLKDILGAEHRNIYFVIAGHETFILDVSEFRKLDGGLSCLSLRF